MKNDKEKALVEWVAARVNDMWAPDDWLKFVTWPDLGTYDEDAIRQARRMARQIIRKIRSAK